MIANIKHHFITCTFTLYFNCHFVGRRSHDIRCHAENLVNWMKSETWLYFLRKIFYLKRGKLISLGHMRTSGKYGTKTFWINPTPKIERYINIIQMMMRVASNVQLCMHQSKDYDNELFLSNDLWSLELKRETGILLNYNIGIYWEYYRNLGLTNGHFSYPTWPSVWLKYGQHNTYPNLDS